HHTAQFPYTTLFRSYARNIKSYKKKIIFFDFCQKSLLIYLIISHSKMQNNFQHNMVRVFTTNIKHPTEAGFLVKVILATYPHHRDRKSTRLNSSHVN